MVCTDRQLQQSQRELGFSTRAGVVKQLRPYSGPNDIAAVVDYINRELFQVVQPMRNKVNEVYLQVAEQAPSANPLRYFFSESTVAADPTTGRLRLNQAVQNTATVIRVSELNARALSATVWLDVMQGSATTPLGVVTLTDSADPGRFIRFDLGSMTDNGTYWDLNVTVTESSHTNPFVEGESVSIGFIAGVASGAIAPAPGMPGIRAVSAGTQSASSGTIVFSNSNGVSFGFSGSTRVTAAFDALKTISLATYATALSSNVSNATDVSLTGNPIVFQHLGTEASLFSRANVLWRMSSNSLVGVAPILFLGGTNAFSANVLSFQDSNGLNWTLSTLPDAGLGRIVEVMGSVTPQLGMISHVGGNSVTNATRLAFSNASGVTWSLSTAASAATVLASVNDQSIGLLSHVGGNSVTNATRLAFSNASNVTFSLSTAVGGATLLASVLSQTAQTFIGGIAGGTQTATSGTIVFSDSNGVSFGLSGSTRMTATVAPRIGIVSHIGGNVVSSVTQLAFSNANNVTFSLSTAANAATLLASVNAGGGGGVAISQGTGIATSGTVNFSNNSILTAGAASASLNNVVFDLDTNQVMRATAVMRVTDGTNSTQTGGFQVTKIQFANSNGVTFGLDSTNDAQGRVAVLTASVAAGGGAAPTMSYHKGGSGRDWANLVIDAGNSFNFVFPINNGDPFPGNMTISTLDVLVQGSSVSSTNGTGSWGFTLQGGLYSLNNSTRLSLINSFSFGTSSTTHASSQSASYNSSYQGQRLITIHSSLWSSQPVLSAGVPYWFAWRPMRVGASAIVSALGAQFAGIVFRGTLGVGTATLQGRMMPFQGMMASAGVPASIANTQIVSTYSGSNIVGIYNFRGNIVQ